MNSAKSIDPTALATGIRQGNRASLARAITLVESTRPDHHDTAAELIQLLLPQTGNAHRIGITGVPGVGKSTTIDQLGMNLIRAGKRVAVVAVDPTSTRTGGSILGDKTRMNSLASAPNAFVRPSPTSGTLGGVARKTRETMLLLEAAGFDTIIVETVGVGQSEVTVSGMVDFFLVLLLAGGGDELQGIKKGVIEIADMIAINKADGNNKQKAEQSAADYRAALALLTPASASWQPPVVAISGLNNEGLDLVWRHINAHRDRMMATGEFNSRRSEQSVAWLHDMLADQLRSLIYRDPELVALLRTSEAEVYAGDLAPSLATRQLMNQMMQRMLDPHAQTSDK